MQRLLSILLLLLLNFTHCSPTTKPYNIPQVLMVEMNLSALGVESDNFPFIKVHIDFVKDSAICTRSYYDPAIKETTYSLSPAEIKKILSLLQNTELEKLKDTYTVAKTDQPTSTTTIYTSKKWFAIVDYGLKGDYPLQELYKIAYKF